MNVGLPGAGIAGLFYLLAALAMPLRELGRALRGRSSARRWRAVAVQTGLALGIIAAIWATAWTLGLLLAGTLTADPGAAGDGAAGAGPSAAERVTGLLAVTPTYLTLATLAAILLGVQVLRLLTGRFPRPARAIAVGVRPVDRPARRRGPLAH